MRLQTQKPAQLPEWMGDTKVMSLLIMIEITVIIIIALVK